MLLQYLTGRIDTLGQLPVWILAFHFPRHVGGIKLDGIELQMHCACLRSKPVFKPADQRHSAEREWLCDLHCACWDLDCSRAQLCQVYG